MPLAGIPRVIPQSDDVAVVYLQEPGSFVGKRSEHLVVKKDGKEINRIPMAAVRQVVAFGNVQISSQAIETLTAHEIPIVYMTGYCRFVASVQPAPLKNVGLRVTQYKRFADPVESLALANSVVRAKLANQVNALLSFDYALLTKDCFAALCTVGFDPYFGFFHQIRHGKPSLALDLMEEFRSVIADSVVLTLINNRLLSTDDFLMWRDACQLTESGRKAFFQAYEQCKTTEVTHPVYGYRMTYSRRLEVQACLTTTTFPRQRQLDFPIHNPV